MGGSCWSAHTQRPPRAAPKVPDPALPALPTQPSELATLRAQVAQLVLHLDACDLRMQSIFDQMEQQLSRQLPRLSQPPPTTTIKTVMTLNGSPNTMTLECSTRC
jgi:hypothetical protein